MNKLKTMREAAGLTQAAASDLAGINLRTWQGWECGRKDINAASFAHIVKICAALNCAPMQIITDPDLLELMTKITG